MKHVVDPTYISASPSKVSVAYPPTESTHITVSDAIILGPLDFFVKALAQEDLVILVSWCGSVAAAARILRAGPQDPKRQASESFADGPRRGDDIPSADRGGWCVYGLEHKGVEW